MISCLSRLALAGVVAMSIYGSARADQRGNGGYGVNINGITYAVDLVARNIHLNPWMAQSQFHVLDATEVLALRQQIIGVAKTDGVVRSAANVFATLQERAADRGFRLSASDYIEAARHHSWISLEDIDCQSVGDETLPFPNQIQLAYRQGNTIHFCKQFGSLDETQKVALIVHEMIYALHHDGQPFVTKLVGLIFDPALALGNQTTALEFDQALVGLAIPRQRSTALSVLTCDDGQHEIYRHVASVEGYASSDLRNLAYDDAQNDGATLAAENVAQFHAECHGVNGVFKKDPTWTKTPMGPANACAFDGTLWQCELTVSKSTLCCIAD